MLYNFFLHMFLEFFALGVNSRKRTLSGNAEILALPWDMERDRLLSMATYSNIH